MEAIILAGGFGTRLSHIVTDVPKPMAPVAGRPFIEYILDELIAQGVSHFVLAVHYKKECLMEYFGSEYRGVPISYSAEETPLLTGGAIKKALSLCKEERVFVVNGDTYFQVSFKEMEATAEQRQATVTIAVKEMEQFSRYGRVEMDKNGKALAFHEKAPCEHGWINGGIYYLNRNALADYPKKFSLENDCFPELLKSGKIFAYSSQGYFIDIGIPEDYAVAQSHFEGKVL